VGFRLGFNEGFQLGFNEGFQLGFNEGFGLGLDEGCNEGFQLGFDEGFKLGFNEGFEVGFNEGFEVGFNEDFLVVTITLTNVVLGRRVGINLGLVLDLFGGIVAISSSLFKGGFLLLMLGLIWLGLGVESSLLFVTCFDLGLNLGFALGFVIESSLLTTVFGLSLNLGFGFGFAIESSLLFITGFDVGIELLIESSLVLIGFIGVFFDLGFDFFLITGLGLNLGSGFAIESSLVTTGFGLGLGLGIESSLVTTGLGLAIE
jgi:hypothetical protein